jgi:hypothetical protein
MAPVAHPSRRRLAAPQDEVGGVRKVGKGKSDWKKNDPLWFSAAIPD